jgi:hypothetical protein
MKKVVVVFFVLVTLGILSLFFISFERDVLTDEPLRVPSRQELVPSGTTSREIIQTVDETRIPELLRPTSLVRSTTGSLLSAACEEGTERCKLQAIYDFVRLNYEHVPSSVQHTYIKSPDQTLLYGSGDSLELALLIASMQRSAGFSNEVIQTPYNVFVRVQLGEESIVIDPACQGCKIMEARVSFSGRERVYR